MQKKITLPELPSVLNAERLRQNKTFIHAANAAKLQHRQQAERLLKNSVPASIERLQEVMEWLGYELIIQKKNE